MEPNKQVDHRWSARQALALPVKIYSGGEPLGDGRTHNVGIGGMCVELSNAPAELPTDAPLSVAFTVTREGGDTSHHRLPATVVWSAGKGAGLMFTDFNVETVHTLRDILYPQ